MDNNEELKKRIAELESKVEVLAKDLIHDPLTGLKTRAFFEEEARFYFDVVNKSSIHHHAERRRWFGFNNVSFIFFDIDNFKSINDNYGHSSGDEVLKKVANTILYSVREGDTVARWGGEEIAVTLVGATEKDARQKAEDIRKSIEAIRFEKIPDLVVTVSAGVASAETSQSFDNSLIRADRAMYEAKKSGKNKVVSYSEIAEKSANL